MAARPGRQAGGGGGPAARRTGGAAGAGADPQGGEPVTEAEWLGSTSAHPMLAHLAEAPDPRKLRLFACACLWRWQAFFPDPSCWALVELSERYAQRRASRQQLVGARN